MPGMNGTRLEPDMRWPPDFGHRELEISYGGESWWEIRRGCFGRQ